MEQNWIEPINGHCPVCNSEVSECGGIEFSRATRWEPADYGCQTVETGEDNTIILAHETPDGKPCEVGGDNDNSHGLCYACDKRENFEDYYDYDNDGDDDWWCPEEPAAWMVTESAW